MTTTAATKYKTRKLFQVRIHRPDHTFSTQVGHKCRLLPRWAAARVARRLRVSGHFITIDPVVVKLTQAQAQAQALDCRYPLSI